MNLTQAENGEWVVSLKHHQSFNDTINVTLKYNGASAVTVYNVGKTYSSDGTRTGWITTPGVKIDTGKITASGTIKVGDTTYQVTGVNWEHVYPAGGGGDLSVVPAQTSVSESGHAGITLTITSDSEDTWTLSLVDSPSWARLSGATTGTGNATNRKVIIDSNSGGERSVTIKLSRGTVESYATISQAAHQGEVTYTLEVNARSGDNYTIDATGTLQLDAFYVKKVDGAEAERTNVTSDASWSVTSGGDYMNVGNSGSAKGKVTGTNSTTSQKSGTVKAIYNSKTGTRNITVNGATPHVITYELVITPASATIDANGQVQLTATYYVLTDGVRDAGEDVTSRATWESTNTSWATVSGGNVTGTNQDTSQHKPTIKATYNGTTGSATITVRGASVELSISAQTTNIAAAGGTILIKVTSNTSWSISSNQEWATFSESTSDSGTKTKTLTIGEYSGTSSREVIITVSDGAGHSDSLTITQNGTNYLKFWDTDRGKLDNLAWDQGGREQVHVDANVEWRIYATESWVHIKNASGQNLTGGSGNEINIYITVDNNETGEDRDASLIIEAIDTTLGVASDSIPVHQKKEEPKFAVFKDKVTTTSGETEHELAGITVSANTYWYISVPNETDWISPGRDCSGNDTSEMPDGVKPIYLNISPNPTVSERNGIVKILGSGGGVYDSLAITQGRGLSTIDIDGTATEVIFSGQTVEFTVVSNTNWHVVSYTSRLVPDGFSTSTTFYAGSTTISFTVPENTGDTSIQYEVKVQTDDNEHYSVYDTYTFSQGAKPPKNGTLFAWYDNDASKSGSRHLKYYHDVPSPSGDDGRPARSASDTDWLANPFTFYVKSNTVNSLVSIECFSLTTSSGSSYKLVTAGTLSETCQIYDDKGQEITCGSTAAQWFGPTTNSGETWVPFTIHLPANTRSGKVPGARRFIIKFKTFDYWNWQPLPGDLDFNWHDSLMIEIDQYGNECSIGFTDYVIDYFLLGNMSDPSETNYTTSGLGHYEYPAVMITGKQVCTAYEGYTTEVQSDYIALNGNLPYTDPDKLVLTATTTDVTVKNENWSVIQYPEVGKPFEVYFHPNTGYTDSGPSREYDMTLVYKSAIPWISKTIHVTQPYQKVTPPELSLYLYVNSMYGGQGQSVKTDSVVVQQSGNQRQVMFSLTGNFNASGISYCVSYTDEGPTSAVFSGGTFGQGWFPRFTGDSLDGYFMNQQPWPGNNIDAIFLLKDSITDDFVIKIIGVSASDNYVTTELTLNVLMTSPANSGDSGSGSGGNSDSGDSGSGDSGSGSGGSGNHGGGGGGSGFEPPILDDENPSNPSPGLETDDNP